MYFVNIIMWITCWRSMLGFNIPDARSYGNSFEALEFMYVQFDVIHSNFDLYKMSNTISILFNILRLFVFMEFHGRLGLVTKTLHAVWEDLYHFFLLFFCTVMMMAFMGWNMLGADCPDFRNWSWSINTILMMSIGEMPDYETEFWRRNAVFGTIFYWIVACLSMLFLMNVLLSIVIDGYIGVADDEKDDRSILTTAYVSIGMICLRVLNHEPTCTTTCTTECLLLTHLHTSIHHTHLTHTHSTLTHTQSMLLHTCSTRILNPPPNTVQVLRLPKGRTAGGARVHAKRPETGIDRPRGRRRLTRKDIGG